MRSGGRGRGRLTASGKWARNPKTAEGVLRGRQASIKRVREVRGEGRLTGSRVDCSLTSPWTSTREKPQDAHRGCRIAQHQQDARLIQSIDSSTAYHTSRRPPKQQRNMPLLSKSMPSTRKRVLPQIKFKTPKSKPLPTQPQKPTALWP